ncbi:MAG: F0F1 ATP synthase subunit epsilon [Proteobacteria bacterium]|nr:F0F1 ATP synthase subunit epsilon [Pseudomonadota bacterium]
MNLTIYLPSEIFLDSPVKKIVGEGPEGSFCILPKHIDFVTALVPGILKYFSESGSEQFLALKEGILVKQQERVAVTTQMAFKGELGFLKETVDRIIYETDDREKQTQTAVARLEAGFIRSFMEIGKNA